MRAIFWLIDEILFLYLMVIIVSAILSWLVAFRVVNTQNRFVYAVVDTCYRLTEPALRPIRRFLPNMGGLDISPIILILLIQFARIFIADTIRPALV
jgi:YggT family protein